MNNRFGAGIMNISLEYFHFIENKLDTYIEIVHTLSIDILISIM